MGVRFPGRVGFLECALDPRDQQGRVSGRHGAHWYQAYRGQRVDLEMSPSLAYWDLLRGLS